eukprot:6946860-Pyramimonas_sp.AAC.1
MWATQGGKHCGPALAMPPTSGSGGRTKSPAPCLRIHRLRHILIRPRLRPPCEEQGPNRHRNPVDCHKDRTDARLLSPGVCDAP